MEEQQEHQPSRLGEKERRVVVSLKSPPPASALHHHHHATSSSSSPSSYPAGASGAGKTSPSSGVALRNPFFDDDDLLAHLQRQHPGSAPALGLGSASPSSSPPSSRSSPPLSTPGHRKDRTTRRSADVLLHMRAIDDGERRTSHGVRACVRACIGNGIPIHPILIHAHAHFL